MSKTIKLLIKVLITVLCFGIAIWLSYIIFFSMWHDIHNFEGAAVFIIIWAFISNPIITLVISFLMGIANSCPVLIAPIGFFIIFLSAIVIMSLTNFMHMDGDVVMLLGLIAYPLTSYYGISKGRVVHSWLKPE